MGIHFVLPAPEEEEVPVPFRIYKKLGSMVPRKRLARFARKWIAKSKLGGNTLEHLLPLMRRPTEVKPFSFEKANRLTSTPDAIRNEVTALAPWDYELELGEVTTRGVRYDGDWLYHRYRASLLVGAAVDLIGDRIKEATVMDVACHCGPFALEFAMRGFKSVVGLDLRPENIEQAKFLARSFAVPNVEFHTMNVRALPTLPKVDIAFCGGLLYHVTFPLELLRDLHEACTDFLVLDTLSHRQPISTFHLIRHKPVASSLEGEAHYELQPTYRAVIDALRAVGFEHVVEIVGESAAGVPLYGDGTTRSFIAFKKDGPTLARVRDSLTALGMS